MSSNPLVEWVRDVVYIGLEKFGRYYSTYRAIVVDNQDPAQLQKLKLIIPGIQDNLSDKWCPPSNVFFGTNWGSQCIPPKGSVVWVEFEKGDPNYPIWRHGYPGTEDTKTLPERFKSVNNFWFQTPQGTTIELNDDDGTFAVYDNFGNRVESLKNNGGVKVTTATKTQLVKTGSNVEPMVLGTELVNVMKDLIKAIQAITVLAQGTPSSTPLNIMDFSSISATLNKILSKINYVE